MLFILVSGRRYAGKDTLADCLARAFREHHPHLTVLRTAFAAALKRDYATCFTADGVSLERLLTDAAYKELHRGALIRWGTEARAREPAVWARHVYEHAVSANPRPAVVIVSDWRFHNEARFLAAKDGVEVLCFRVCANDQVRRERGWQYDAAVDLDASETELDHGFCGLHVSNTGSVDDLYGQCHGIVSAADIFLRA